MTVPDSIRLNKLINNAGICSRRTADRLIQAGHITVNGQPVTTLGYKVTAHDVVHYRGRRLRAEKLVYVLLNKPKDYITTAKDPQGRKTVLDLTQSACTERIFPVGRLDRNTTGLLLLTNDGDLAKKLSHPASNVKKLYQVTLDKKISEADLAKIQAGITLEGGLAQIDQLAIVSQDRKNLGLAIHMGKNRIVRRIFEHLRYQVIRLDRVMYGGLTKRGLPRGKWRMLTTQEIRGMYQLIMTKRGAVLK
ncbi:MAG: pseudouridine synthase [Bacteroidota bacterium]